MEKMIVNGKEVGPETSIQTENDILFVGAYFPKDRIIIRIHEKGKPFMSKYWYCLENGRLIEQPLKIVNQELNGKNKH